VPRTAAVALRRDEHELLLGHGRFSCLIDDLMVRMVQAVSAGVKHQNEIFDEG
jgi:hypothetical protein